MIFLGSIVNFFTIVIGAVIGSFLKKGIPKKITEALTFAMGLAVLYIGITGLNFDKDINALIVIISMAIGVIVGELLNLDGVSEKLGKFFEKKFSKKESEDNKFSKGFVNCTLIFCIGAMAINGALNSANGDHSILYAKSIIDCITCMVFATTFGIGCILSAFSTFIYQGLLTVIFYFIISSVDQTGIMYQMIINHVGSVGSLLIIAISLNMLKVTKIKTANLIPAMLCPLFLCPLFNLLGI